MLRVLVLVIVSFDKPVYYDMLKVWRERCLTNPPISCDVWFVQCKPESEWIGDIVNDLRERSIQQSLRLKNPPLCGESQSLSLEDRFELDRENKTLFVRGDECLIPGILHKTVEALSYFLSLTPTYDYVWRTNLSSVLDFAGLQQYLSSLDKGGGFYGGYIGKAASGATESGHLDPIFFASGAGFLMSRDVALYLVENKSLLRWDLIDDVAIGALLEPRFGIVPIDRCWVQTGSEDLSVTKGVFHFRCESYQHLRTVEFMRYVSKFV